MTSTAYSWECARTFTYFMVLEFEFFKNILGEDFQRSKELKNAKIKIDFFKILKCTSTLKFSRDTWMRRDDTICCHDCTGCAILFKFQFPNAFYGRPKKTWIMSFKSFPQVFHQFYHIILSHSFFYLFLLWLYPSHLFMKLIYRITDILW